MKTYNQFLNTTYPASSIGAPGGAPAKPAGGTAYLDALGLGDLVDSAKLIVANQLNGLPSPSLTRTANAYFGSQSGLAPTSDFIRNRGYDLYNQKAEARQQAGLGNMGALIGQVTQPELARTAQQEQSGQFYAQLGQQGGQFNQDIALKQFLADLQAMGLAANIASMGKTAIPSFNF